MRRISHHFEANGSNIFPVDPAGNNLLSRLSIWSIIQSEMTKNGYARGLISAIARMSY
jgi:hypothetical protein